MFLIDYLLGIGFYFTIRIQFSRISKNSVKYSKSKLKDSFANKMKIFQ